MHKHTLTVTERFRTDGKNQTVPSVQSEGTLFRFLNRDDCDTAAVGEWAIRPDGDGGIILRVLSKEYLGEIELLQLRNQALDRCGGVLAMEYTPDARAAWRLDTNPLPALRKRHPWLEWKHIPATSGTESWHKERVGCPVAGTKSNYLLG